MPSNDSGGGWEDPCFSGVPGMRLIPRLQAAIDDDGELPPSLFHIPGMHPVAIADLAAIPEDMLEPPALVRTVGIGHTASLIHVSDQMERSDDPPRFEYGGIDFIEDVRLAPNAMTVSFDIGADLRKAMEVKLDEISAIRERAIESFIDGALLKLVQRRGYNAPTALPRSRLDAMRADIRAILEIIAQ